MKIELLSDRQKGYLVCFLMILISALYLMYLAYNLRQGGPTHLPAYSL